MSLQVTDIIFLNLLYWIYIITTHQYCGHLFIRGLSVGQITQISVKDPIPNKRHVQVYNDLTRLWLPKSKHPSIIDVSF